MIRIRSIEPLEGYHVRLTFTDGTIKTVDLEPFLMGPIFEPLRQDTNKFRAMRVDEELGTIVWDNGADICPDVLYYGRTPAWMEDMAKH